MKEFIQKIFESDFMPHGHCFFWKPDVLWLHVISDGIIAISYYSIPFFLIYLVKKRKDLTFRFMFLLFGLFIFFCGTTHLMEIYTFWVPIYRVEGLIKAGTALVSLTTGLMLIPLIPQALKIPSPTMLKETNEKLKIAKDELETKVQERTAELSKNTEDLKKEIAQRKLAQDKLEQTNRELREFAFIVSHDLKSPIRSVGTLSDLLTIDYGNNLDEQGQEYLTMIKQGAVRMEQIINSILRYSKIGNITSETEPVNLNKVVNEVINLLKPPPNITIKIENDLPTLEMERAPIFQVFHNLIQNAIKYIDKPKGEISIGCSKEGEFWEFYVSDNGIGIKREYYEKIFKMFQTLAPTATKESTGIGLAIVQKIIRMYGGDIWIDSKVGEYTKFHFTLPATTSEIDY